MFWTPDEMAEQLGVSRVQLDHLRCDGSGPPFLKVGRAVRYHVPTVMAWARARSRTVTGPVRVVAGGGQ